MPQLGPLEILVVAIVALMVFGPKRLPEVGRQVGHGIRELRKIQETVRAEIHDVLNAPDTPSYTSNDDSGSDAGSSLAPGAMPAGYRTSGTPTAPVGRSAPSRFRTATSGLNAAPPVEPSDRVVPTRGSGMRAPSRFRTPGA